MVGKFGIGIWRNAGWVPRRCGREFSRVSSAWMCVLLAIHLPAAARAQEWTAWDYAARLGAGVNFGNTLEAPREGDWGFRLEPWHFAEISAAGFDHVRVPIRWNAHAAEQAPYAVDGQFWERIDWVVDQALRYDLAVILDFHHYDELHVDPDGHRARLLGIWDQIATHYQDAPNTVYFELLNEPHDALGPARWNALLAETLQMVRGTNPDRPVIIGPANWNSINSLNQLVLPEEDHNLITTFHYYSPFEFTHQGAEWVEGADAWLGRTWTGTSAQRRAIERDFSLASAFAGRVDRPVYLGEFGAYSTAGMDSRAAWTQFIAETADARGFPRAYWEFGAGFGVYDRSQRAWVEPLYDALQVQSVFDVNQDREVSRGDFLELLDVIGTNDVHRGDLNHDGVADTHDVRFWSYFAGVRTGDLDGDGQWTPADIDRLTAETARAAPDLQFDLDNSGQLDAGDRNYLVTRLMRSYFGDANLDGEFNSTDMVQVFSGGKYERAEHADWVDGDWDGNGVFESGDLVLALAQGVYELGPRRNVAVPEAVAGLPGILAGLLPLCRLRSRRR